MVNSPDNWVVIKFKGNDPHYRVLAGWSSSYLYGSGWRLNSGITRVEEYETHFSFYGTSNSCYKCSKGSYGLKMNNVHIWNQIKDIHEDNVEILPENTNWKDIDWIINNGD